MAQWIKCLPIGVKIGICIPNTHVKPGRHESHLYSYYSGRQDSGHPDQAG